MIQINKKVPIGINATFYLKNGSTCHVDFDDNFECFKYMILEFKRMIETRHWVINPQETISIIRAIIKGREYVK